MLTSLMVCKLYKDYLTIYLLSEIRYLNTMKPIASSMTVFIKVQFAYYIYCLHATIFVDLPRKDTSILIYHHIHTLFVLYISYGIK